MYRPWRSRSPGKSTSRRRGSRRKTASSRSNGRLVAPITITLSSLEDLNPSISCMNSVNTPRCENPLARSREDIRAPKRASISSKNTTHGAILRARVKTALTSFSPSPTYYESCQVPSIEQTRMAHHIHNVRRRDSHHATTSLFGESTDDERFTCARRAEKKTSSHPMVL